MIEIIGMGSRLSRHLLGGFDPPAQELVSRRSKDGSARTRL